MGVDHSAPATVATAAPSIGAAYLQHVQQCSLSRIVQSKEQKFGMFVEETQGGKDIVDCTQEVSIGQRTMGLSCARSVITYTS